MYVLYCYCLRAVLRFTTIHFIIHFKAKNERLGQGPCGPGAGGLPARGDPAQAPVAMCPTARKPAVPCPLKPAVPGPLGCALSPPPRTSSRHYGFASLAPCAFLVVSAPMRQKHPEKSRCALGFHGSGPAVSCLSQDLRCTTTKRQPALATRKYDGGN